MAREQILQQVAASELSYIGRVKGISERKNNKLIFVLLSVRFTHVVSFYAIVQSHGL